MANVNRPTDNEQKTKDINQKLQLYGIYSAFANGKAPSNKQIDVALNSALASKPLANPSKKLSSEGHHLVEDVRDVIKQAKLLLLSKNEGNLIQEFIWDAQGISAADASTPNAPIDKATAQQHGDQALEGLKTLGRLVLSNGQFRKLLNDATVLVRDIAGDAAQTAANKVNPDEEKLKRIDEPAPDNTWHDVPDLSKESLKAQARDAYNQNKPFSRDDAAQAVQQGIDHAQNQQGVSTTEALQAGAQHTANNLQGQADSNVPEETKENARKAKEAALQNTKNYLGKKMPTERREQTFWRLKKMLVEIQGHGDYQEAISTLLYLAETYGGHAKDLTTQSAGTVKGLYSQSKPMLTKLKTLIERFANFTSADDLFDALNQIYRDADQDAELKLWFKNLDKFIRRCLQEQGYVLREQSNQEYNALYDKGQFLLRERYRDHTDHLLDEVKFLGDQFDQDPQNRAFGDAVQKLFLDLGRDENGKAVFKKHLLTDVTEVIIPGIFENTRYIPIPRIEVSDPMVDLVIENLVIESDNLFPNALEFGTDNYWRFGRKQIKNHRDNKVMIAGSGVQMDLRDVAYYVKKKQGFPSITDKGVMDVILAGDGFSFKIAARNAQKSDRTHFIAIDKVDVTVKSLAIKIKKSNHKLLFSIAKPLVLKVMKPAIQKAIEKNIRDNFEKADEYLYAIHKEAQKAAQAVQDNPEDAPNIYQRYANAFQAKMTEKKQKAEQKVDRAKETKINMAVTQQDSMFKNISLPGGISTKATEYKELAAKGDRWESPVFSIGSAKESTDIPKASSVARKPHATTTPGIRGGNHPNATSAAPGANTFSAAGVSGAGSTATTTVPGTTTGAAGLTGASTAGTTGTATFYDSATTQP